ncbi:MAG: WD40 repeat domain-containing protein [Magnetococcales bacterium]|nr:WD40 repeat domain-containing protein [Magnetococcales bacterium]
MKGDKNLIMNIYNNYNGEIGLGDCLRACTVLKNGIASDSNSVACLLRMLGLSLQNNQNFLPEQVNNKIIKNNQNYRKVKDQAPPPPNPQPEDAKKESLNKPDQGSIWLPPQLDPGNSYIMPKIIKQALPLPEPGNEKSVNPPDPLWAELEVAGRLRDLLGTVQILDTIDADVAVEHLARCEPLELMPRNTHRTMAKGVLLVEDWGKNTLPFQQDMIQFRKQLQRWVGIDRVDILKFNKFPWQILPNKHRQEENLSRYLTPARPVLAITRFSRWFEDHHGTDWQDWQQFYKICKKHDCMLIIATTRIPEQIRKIVNSGVKMVTWDAPNNINKSMLNREMDVNYANKIKLESNSGVDILKNISMQAFELGKLASLAIRVEPRLLRSLRKRFLPECDAEVEAELWFSPVVGAAFSSAFEFLSYEQNVLRRHLLDKKSFYPYSLDDIWKVYQEEHNSIPNVFMLAERVAFLALKGGRGSIREIKDHLSGALKAVIEQGRTGVARWAVCALHDLLLLKNVRKIDISNWLLLSSYFHLVQKDSWTDSVPLAGAVPRMERIAWLIRGMSNLPTTKLLTRWQGIDVSLHWPEDNTSDVSSNIINVPATNPIWLKALKSNGEKQIILIKRGGTQLLRVSDGYNAIATLDGNLHCVRVNKVPSIDCDKRILEKVLSCNWQLIALPIPVRYLNTNKSIINSIAWSHDNKLLSIGNAKGNIGVYDLRGNELYLADGCNRTRKGPDHQVRSVAWSPDCQVIASGADDGYLKIWDINNSLLLNNIKISNYGVTDIAWSPAGSLLAIGSKDHAIYIVDFRTGAIINKLESSVDTVFAVAWSPNGGLLASGSWDKKISIWNTETWSLISEFYGHEKPILSLKWAKSSNIIATGSKDKSLRLWDIVSGEQVKLMDHMHEVRSVSWSQKGCRIASGALDCRVRVWDLANGKYWIVKLDRAVYSVAFSPSGDWLAASFGDGLIGIWDCSALDLI